ncbi:MAG: right-handed parallel beta-helix repeat-containing protein [Thermus sp.]|uniref:right-handed parallel beta-helix repeat-containing protein n=1 Tax=unclassified Thermus TaxID=2619321 RepID=UPI0005440771|nr:right-handed parallel beta-helix repeat-containing protein [Thermus sp. 2.9]KHG64429.1 copper-binding protein [Thermus sp. 2.9]
MRLLAVLASFPLALAAPALRLQGEVAGPLVLTTPGLVVEGQGAVVRGKAGHTVRLLAPGIRVRGLRVVGAGPREDFFEPDAAFYLQGCHGCVLEDVRVEGAPTAVRAEDSRGLIVRRLRARGLRSAPGVLIYKSPRAQVEESRLEGYVDAIYVEYSPGLRLVKNALWGNSRYGFHVMFTWEAWVEENRSWANAIGNALMHGALNLVRGNRLEGHATPLGYGLLVQDERQSQVLENTFLANTLGLVLLDAVGVEVRGNRFLENGTALRLTRERGANSARVHGNAFQGNLYDLLVDDPQAQAKVEGNAYDRASPLPVPHLPTGSFALFLALQPELSLFALSPGVVLWEAAEAQVPGLRLIALADNRAQSLPRGTRGQPVLVLLGLAGGLVWWRWKT